MPRQREKDDSFQDLTWDDLREWAGSTILSRGQSYQRSRQVEGLARTPGGGVVAWVQGTKRYVTKVDFAGEDLTSICTCPYGGTCKHAVAVVLEYLECLKKNKAVPQSLRERSAVEISGGGWRRRGLGRRRGRRQGRTGSQLPSPSETGKRNPRQLIYFSGTTDQRAAYRLTKGAGWILCCCPGNSAGPPRPIKGDSQKNGFLFAERNPKTKLGTWLEK